MKHWNELDGSVFFNKIFSTPIEIGKIALFSLRIENDQPCIGMGFDIPEFPDNLPEKWKNKGFNTCRIGITCNEIKDLQIRNIPMHEIFSVKIKKDNNHFTFEAISNSASIIFKANFISLSGPSVYINGPDDYYFKQ
ncbi:Imm50 family immunity protein [Pseudomonas sp. EYE_354]|uniref:Imm50 family immunity protein n=1 Tax=Pseudomonas sp. EYE_354 TaxID=2853449 RepID=UPI0020034583|nr:Imm50 family immunity protein [Pseudomonas sp. EYE_354]MCK6186769.1 immunity 50 family protein [Pseudomonas sp. EYE_354]